MPSHRQSVLQKEILRHLVENPEAMDTLEGIARFWILRQRVEKNLEDVEAVVLKLLKEGYLMDRPMRDASGHIVQRYFQLNSTRLPDIRALLGIDNK